MIDCHMHYTGSLPPEYMYQHLRNKCRDFLGAKNISTYEQFTEYMRGLFASNYLQNRKNFDDIYRVFQRATKPTVNIQDAYRDGAYQLAKNLIQRGITDYTIIAGPNKDINVTYERYKGMIKGFEQAEHEAGTGYGKINMTFIRTSKDNIKNYSLSLLNDICHMLTQEPFKSRCRGFDISGYEYPDKELFKNTINLLDEIFDTTKKYNLAINIGLHAGEVITNTDQDEIYAEYFAQLSKKPITNIGHGTYLWATDKHADILKQFAGWCRFDICPTSNRLLTPYGDIQTTIRKLNDAGIQYTLNLDDPLVFSCWQLF